MLLQSSCMVIPKDIALKSASFILTENCNLNCTYCYTVNTRDIKKIMSEEVAEKGIDFLISQALSAGLNGIQITFFGGEPTLNTKVMKHIIDYGYEKCTENNLLLDCLLVTNGYLWPEGFESLLLRWYELLGHINIQISCDGNKESQDKNRPPVGGGSSSEKVYENILKYRQFFIKNNIPLETRVSREKGTNSLNSTLLIHACITKETLPKLYDNYCTFRDLGFDGVWFMPVHEEDWEDEDVDNFYRESKKIADRILKDCIEEGTDKFYKAYSSFYKNYEKHPVVPCGAGKTYCTVTPDGDIYPCHGFYFGDKSSKLGNVYEGNLDLEERSIFLDYSSENLFGDKPCTDCDNYSCYRCIATNKINNKNMLIGFPKFCKMARAENVIRKILFQDLINSGFLNGKNQPKKDKMYKILEVIDSTLYEIKNCLTELNLRIKILEEMGNFNIEIQEDILKAISILNLGGKK